MRSNSNWIKEKKWREEGKRHLFGVKKISELMKTEPTKYLFTGSIFPFPQPADIEIGSRFNYVMAQCNRKVLSLFKKNTFEILLQICREKALKIRQPVVQALLVLLNYCRNESTSGLSFNHLIQVVNLLHAKGISVVEGDLLKEILYECGPRTVSLAKHYLVDRQVPKTDNSRLFYLEVLEKFYGELRFKPAILEVWKLMLKGNNQYAENSKLVDLCVKFRLDTFIKLVRRLFANDKLEEYGMKFDDVVFRINSSKLDCSDSLVRKCGHCSKALVTCEHARTKHRERITDEMTKKVSVCFAEKEFRGTVDAYMNLLAFGGKSPLHLQLAEVNKMAAMAYDQLGQKMLAFLALQRIVEQPTSNMSENEEEDHWKMKKAIHGWIREKKYEYVETVEEETETWRCFRNRFRWKIPAKNINIKYRKVKRFYDSQPQTSAKAMDWRKCVPSAFCNKSQVLIYLQKKNTFCVWNIEDNSRSVLRLEEEGGEDWFSCIGHISVDGDFVSMVDMDSMCVQCVNWRTGDVVREFRSCEDLCISTANPRKLKVTNLAKEIVVLYNLTVVSIVDFAEDGLNSRVLGDSISSVRIWKDEDDGNGNGNVFVFVGERFCVTKHSRRGVLLEVLVLNPDLNLPRFVNPFVMFGKTKKQLVVLELAPQLSGMNNFANKCRVTSISTSSSSSNSLTKGRRRVAGCVVPENFPDAFDISDNFLVVASETGSVHIFDLLSGDPIKVVDNVHPQQQGGSGSGAGPGSGSGSGPGPAGGVFQVSALHNVDDRTLLIRTFGRDLRVATILLKYESLRLCASPSCGRDDLKLMSCSRCKSVFYCNSTCQRKHWKKHKKVCRKV